jgi:uncharacterized OB-fold protein
MPDPGSTAIADPIPVEDLGPIDVVETAGTGLPSLRGSSCPECQQVAFPPRHRCSRCYHSPQDKVSLSHEGSLYAFSTVHVSATVAVPYTLGFVDLPGDVRVLCRLFGSADSFGIGDTVAFAVHDGDWGFEKAQRRTVSHG